jgi:hypothetical protein
VVVNDAGDVFYSQQPETLHAEDLVFGNYQNGRLSGAWFRGRVAAVHPAKKHTQNSNASTASSVSTSVCDIAYDDAGEYKCNIPYGRGHFNIKLIEKGAEHPAWMEGLSVKVISRRKPAKCLQFVQPKRAVQSQWKRTNTLLARTFHCNRHGRGRKGPLPKRTDL